MTIHAMICGSGGPVLTAQEIVFFQNYRPAGYILFARNCKNPEQIKSLVQSFRDAVDHDALILIDQEGGRVQRLVPPEWPRYPTSRVFGALYDRDQQAAQDAVWLAANLIGHDLADLGINMDCLPVLDLDSDEGHDVIGDRAYHHDPAIVATLGRKACEGLLAAGILPVIKHIPGHGRAGADSHLNLPVVDAEKTDLEQNEFAPFHELSDMPAAMTAHVLYTSLDEKRPATVSLAIIQQVIREQIGFDGLLMSDDVSMGALEGTIAERTLALIEAGCDVALHCNGDLVEMEQVAENVPKLKGAAWSRFKRALAQRQRPNEIDRVEAIARLQKLIA